MPPTPAASVPPGGRRGRAASPAGPWVVVGLGNPGPKYAGNRHNVGAAAVAQLAVEYGATLRTHRTRCLVAQVRIAPPALVAAPSPGRIPGGRPGSAGTPPPPVPVVLAQPTTYMNEAGGPVRALVDYFGGSPASLIVVHDDLELDFGTIRVKPGGGAAGHNGLRSVAAALGTTEFARVRIGIGRPRGRQDPAAYVLHDFASVEQRELPLVFADVRDEIERQLASFGRPSRTDDGTN